MAVAKIIIVGGPKSFKTTLARFIQEALDNDCIESEVNEDFSGQLYRDFQKSLDNLCSSDEVVEIEVRSE